MNWRALLARVAEAVVTAVLIEVGRKVIENVDARRKAADKTEEEETNVES